jgi:hypothetical protein
MVAYTTSEEDAIRLLTATRRRHIDNGREIADEILAKRPVADVGQVYQIMAARGLIDYTIPQHWLGAVFRVSAKYRWTGHMVQTNIGHDDLAKVWESAKKPPAFTAEEMREFMADLGLPDE